MQSNRSAILEAYSATLQDRTVEVQNLAVGKAVEDGHGERFEVIAFSNKLDEVSKYDTNKLAQTINENHNMAGAMWVAVKDSVGRTGVFTYGDDGVILIDATTKTNEHNQLDETIVGAYMSVINEAEEDEAPELDAEADIEADAEIDVDVPEEDEDSDDDEEVIDTTDKPTISLSVFQTDIGDIEGMAKKYKVEANNFNKTNFGREVEFTVTGPKENLKNIVGWALEVKGEELDKIIEDNFPDIK